MRPCPGFADDRDYARMREVLVDADYTPEGTKTAIGEPEIFTPPANVLPTYLHRTRSGSPVDTLIRLFNFAVPVKRTDAEAAIAPMKLETWEEGGFLEVDGDRVRPLVRICPAPAFYVVVELPFRMGKGLAGDRVMDIAPSTIMLAEATMRRPVETLLDLGTGCGYHALRAAGHVERVTAADLNPRAAAFTELNAKLNAVANIETVVGDRFEPVAGRRFDMIISNPPYVITPGKKYTFRDGGEHGDDFVRGLIRQVSDYLVPGGFCQFILEWAHIRDEVWQERVSSWFQDTGLDAWVMRLETSPADEYASRWISTTETFDTEESVPMHEEWMRYYESMNIEFVSFGVATMRYLPEGPNWFAADDSMPARVGEWGLDVAAIFQSRDLMARAGGPEDVFSVVYRKSPGVRLAHESVLKDGKWVVEGRELVRTEGLCYRTGVSAQAAGLVANLDGVKTLGQLVAELAAELEVDPSELTGPALDAWSHFLQLGIVERVTPATA